MLRNFVTVFVELAVLVLQRPEELPIYLQKIPGIKWQILTSITLSSISSSVGFYFLRDFYDSGYITHILLLTANQLILFLLSAVIFGSVIDSFVRLQKPDRAGQNWPMTGIVLLSAFPFIFFLSGAMPARLLRHPIFIIGPVSLGLYIWSLYIVIRGLQYLYELSLGRAVIVYLKAAAVVLFFPGVFLVFMSMELLELLN